jgi:hypothetical protein
MKTSQEHAAPSVQPSIIVEESLQQPIWHVIVLNVLTMFAYSFMWFYKNRQQLSISAKSRLESGEVISDETTAAGLNSLAKVSPLLWTVLLLLPVIQLVSATWFFNDVYRISPQPWLGKRYALPVAVLTTGSMLGLLCLGHLPGVLYLLFLTAAIPLAAVQYVINGYWKQAEPPGKIVRHAFNVWELLGLIVGSMILGLNIVHFMTQH